MIHFIKTTISVILVSVACSTAMADDLFSEVTISSVFAGDQDSVESEVSVSNGRRVTGASSIRKLLADAGLKGEEVDSQTVVVPIEAPRTKDNSLSAVLKVNVDKGQMVVAFPLVKVNESNASSTKLLELMAAGNTGEGIYFFYQANTKWLGIRRILRNENVSSSWLKSQLDEMVVVAQENVDVWQPLGNTLLEDDKVKETPKAKAQTKTPVGPVMAGNWNANGATGEVYSLSFTGNKFSLKITTGGKEVKSNGTWTLQDGKLTLSGEGLTLTGTVTSATSTQFVLTLTNRKPLTFAKNR